jgi:transposase
MAKGYRAYLPEQDLLLPPSLRDWLPENHLAHFVSDVVDEPDLSAIESLYEKEEQGQPPYHPRMGIFLTSDAEEIGGGCGLPDAGSGE